MSITVTVYDHNTQGPGWENNLNLSPWSPPVYTVFDFSNLGPQWEDFGEPSGCGNGLTVSPCQPEYPWNPEVPGSSVPEPSSIALMAVVGVVLILGRVLKTP